MLNILRHLNKYYSWMGKPSIGYFEYSNRILVYNCSIGLELLDYNFDIDSQCMLCICPGLNCSPMDKMNILQCKSEYCCNYLKRRYKNSQQCNLCIWLGLMLSMWHKEVDNFDCMFVLRSKSIHQYMKYIQMLYKFDNLSSIEHNLCPKDKNQHHKINKLRVVL